MSEEKWLFRRTEGSFGANGLDACLSLAYVHIGCPVLPAGIVNIIDTATGRPLRAMPVLMGATHPLSIAFSPNGELVVINGTVPRFDHPKSKAVVATLPDLRTTGLVFCKDSRRAYVIGPDEVIALEILR